MPLGGRAWRGWFPLGGELTSGRPDWKEGLYFGTELGDDHPRVRRRRAAARREPVPGDDVLPGFRADGRSPGWRRSPRSATALMEGIAARSTCPPTISRARYTADPLILFRIFHYPSRPVPGGLDVRGGVGEHTDYGLLTLLRQDAVGGLQVHTPRRLDRGAAVAGHRSSATSATCSTA